MKKTCIITGANGMDAKSLTRFLQHKNYNIILTYRRNSLFNKENWFKEVQIDTVNMHKISFEMCDITDQNSVRELVREVMYKHGIIHELYLLATASHVGDSFKNKENAIATSGQSVYNFLETLKEFSGVTKTYLALTSELAGNVPNGFVFNEETCWHPKSPYAIGKALGGHWARFYRESLDSELYISCGILFNHSNWFRTDDFFIQKICKSAANISLGKTNSIKLGNLDFYRDEHWSDFGVEMMWTMLQQPEPDDYVLATGNTHHGEEFLDLAFNHFNLDWKQCVIKDENLVRPNEVVRLIGDSSKAQKVLGWNPNRINFKDHIGNLCNYNLHKLTEKEFILPNLYLPKS